MKKTRLILAASMLAIGAFTTTTMTSCSKDDQICNTGFSGSDCKTQVRDTYNNTYRGTGTDNLGGTYTNWNLRFTSQGTDATKMSLEVLDENNANKLLFDIVLTSNTTYMITPKTSGAFSYDGNGSISATNASLTINEKDNTTGTIVTTVYTFPNMTKI
jgi:hypothetical protein